MNTEALFIPDARVSGPKVSLLKPISAIQLVKKENGQVKLGLLTQLRPGTTLERCGEGFNERTAKVRADGQCYFAFVQDIESQTGPAH